MFKPFFQIFHFGLNCLVAYLFPYIGINRGIIRGMVGIGKGVVFFEILNLLEDFCLVLFQFFLLFEDEFF